MSKGSVNKVILIGNLGADPEVRTTTSGSSVASLRIATSETWNDRQTGERTERTEWHRVTLYGRLGEVAGQYLRKGSKVYLEGRLQTRKWQDKDGNDRYTTEIVLQGYDAALVMLDGRGEGGGAGAGARGGSEMGYSGGGASRKMSGPKESFSQDLDDEIPF